MFSYEFCEISKSTFTEHLYVDWTVYMIGYIIVHMIDVLLIW